MSELGDRIREAAESRGTIEGVAELAGIPRRTLYSYLKGPREPKAAQLAAIADVTGVTLEWLITGQEPKFRAAAQQPSDLASQGLDVVLPEVDIVLLQAIGDRVQAVFVECKQWSPGRSTLKEAGSIYNELLRTVSDISDQRMVEAVLPVLLDRFKARIATAEPGSGKRSASGL